jgi:hypothetical protein
MPIVTFRSITTNRIARSEALFVDGNTLSLQEHALLKPIFEIAKIRTLSLPKGLLGFLFSPLCLFGRLRDRNIVSFQQSIGDV